MYIPEKLKLNKFRKCAIPSNREYFSRYGFAVSPSGQYTGDERVPVAPLNKVDSIVDYMNYAEQEAAKKADSDE